MKKRDNPFLGIGYKGEEYFCDRTKETEAAKKKKLTTFQLKTKVILKITLQIYR